MSLQKEKFELAMQKSLVGTVEDLQGRRQAMKYVRTRFNIQKTISSVVVVVHIERLQPPRARQCSGPALSLNCTPFLPSR
jgi:hypothetical protein